MNLGRNNMKIYSQKQSMKEFDNQDVIHQWNTHNPFVRASKELINQVEKLNNRCLIQQKEFDIQNMEEALF